jgi:hypothetical protein
MAIDVPKYNTQFLEAAQAGQAYNDSANYGVEVKAVANMGNAQHYWRVVGVHHLTGDENMGNHHIYCDVLDENGQRINGARVILRQGGSNPLHAVVDKPVNEAGTNIPMWSNTQGNIAVNWPEGSQLPSEEAGEIRSTHPDEPPGNTWGHHSFYVVFQRTAVSAAPEPEPVPDPGTGTQPEPPDPSMTLEETIAAAGQPLIIPLNPDAMFYIVAKQQGLGERLTSEYDTEYQGRTYRAQIYEKGILYAEVGDWGNVKTIPRTN